MGMGMGMGGPPMFSMGGPMEAPPIPGPRNVNTEPSFV
jgi:hypothetical protein